MSVPVVVLAGSSFRADIRRALELGANSYAAKPGKLEELEVLIDQIADVWLARPEAATLSHLPGPSQGTRPSL